MLTIKNGYWPFWWVSTIKIYYSFTKIPPKFRPTGSQSPNVILMEKSFVYQHIRYLNGITKFDQLVLLYNITVVVKKRNV